MYYMYSNGPGAHDTLRQLGSYGSLGILAGRPTAHRWYFYRYTPLDEPIIVIIIGTPGKRSTSRLRKIDERVWPAGVRPTRT